MFYISVNGDWGACVVSNYDEPTWDLDNAKMFETRAEAEDYIRAKGKEWVGVDGGEDTMTVCEMGI